MENIEKYESVLKRMNELTSGLLNDAAKKDYEDRVLAFTTELEKQKYIKVPLVGVFSAGKSSLLNVFTQKSGMLPIDVLPETAIAYELYYGTDEKVELYRDEKLIEECSITQIKSLHSAPGDVAKVYCDSEPVKQLQDKGIILVDMPGIGSGIERHDAAIMNYLNEGTAFVLLVDAEQGSLRGSTMTFMEELSKYGLAPAVLVSKIDKKPESEIKEIVEYIQYQMEKVGIEHPFVSTVCAVNHDLLGLQSFLNILDANELIAKRMGGQLKLIISYVIDQLKTRIGLRQTDIANVDEKLKKIETEIDNVRIDQPIDNSNADTPEKSTSDILESIESALCTNVDALAMMIVQGVDQEEIKQKLISIVRSAIIVSFKEESEQYSMAVGAAVQDSMRDIIAIDIDDSVFNDLSGVIEMVKIIVTQLIGKLGGPLGQIIALIISQLDKILGWLFGKSDEDRMLEVREKLLENVFPSLLSNMKPSILDMVTNNQERIRSRVQTEIVSRMERMKEGLQEKIEDENKSKSDVESEIMAMQTAIEELEPLKEAI